MLYKAIKLREWGQVSAEHMINFSTDNNSFITVYDYDLKALCLFSFLIVAFGGHLVVKGIKKKIFS
jgi:hypothetical protein